MTKRTRWLGAAVVVGLLSLAAPAGATTHKTTTTTHPKKTHHKGITKAAAGKQYLADVGPFNIAANAYSSGLRTTTKFSQLAALAAPLLAASQTFDSAALRQQWPSGVRADIKALVSADGAEEGDLESLETADATNIDQINASLTKDGNTTAADSNIVRSDLGLPAPSG